jgi:hypothetical protein
MGILNTGRNKQIALVKEDITKGMSGRDGTLFNMAQTQALNPITETLLNVVKHDITNGIKVSYILPEGLGNEDTVKEFELISKDNSTRYTRIVIPDYDKTEDKILNIDTYLQWDIN